MIAVLLPFFVLLGFDYICYSFIYTSYDVIYTELSPMKFLRPVAAAYDTNGLVISIGALILFFFYFYANCCKGWRSEIY